jgi:hypothetical protein
MALSSSIAVQTCHMHKAKGFVMNAAVYSSSVRALGVTLNNVRQGNTLQANEFI